MSHLRIFGSLCYKHITDARWKKLQDKSESMILVGYHGIGAYRLYNPSKKRIEVSRDVLVCENESWNWEQQKSRVSNLIPVSDENKNSKQDYVHETDADFEGADSGPTPVQEPQRQRQIPSRFQNFEMLPDNAITDDGDWIHFALLTDIEPINFTEPVKELTWKNAMLEELKAIEKNKTWE